jgi:hypothetical protein
VHVDWENQEMEEAGAMVDLWRRRRGRSVP